MKIELNEEQLYDMIKKAVREVLQEEKMELILKNVDPVTKEEMKDIKKLYGKPTQNKDVAHSETMEI